MAKRNSNTSNPSKLEKKWAMWTHLSGLSGFIIPFANIIIPVIIMTMKEEESTFIYKTAKEVVNFQITLLIASIISLILIMAVIGALALVVLIILQIVWTIQAAQSVKKGTLYSYPFTIRFLK